MVIQRIFIKSGSDYLKLLTSQGRGFITLRWRSKERIGHASNGWYVTNVQKWRGFKAEGNAEEKHI